MHIWSEISHEKHVSLSLFTKELEVIYFKQALYA